jgi:hypothetical protein
MIKWLFFFFSNTYLLVRGSTARPTAQREHEMEHRTTVDVVALGRFFVIELLAAEDEPLLHWWDALLLLHLFLDALDLVLGVNVNLNLTWFLLLSFIN